MKNISEISISILGIYLIVKSISLHAGSFFSMSSEAGFRDYFFMFGPSFILCIGGVLCLIYRSVLSEWILRGKDIDLPENLDIDKIERVILSIIGITVVLGLFPYFAMTVNQFIVSPEYQQTEIGNIPIKSYAFVQVVALFVELVLAVILIFFPQKVQNILHKSRRL